MSPHFAAMRAEFRRLHTEECFVLANPWDIGSAKRLIAHGFPALASSSAGLAWSLGCKDYELSSDQVVAHLAELCAVASVPVNADFEDGFSADPAGVAENVTRAIDAGVAGLSIEDRLDGGLYATEMAVERLRAARGAIDASGCDVMLVARCEGYLVGQPDLEATIARLKAYAGAGADCLYAPGLREIDDIARVVAQVAPLPVNVLLMPGVPDVATLASVGVQRLSIGGGFAAAAWAGFEAAVAHLQSTGTMPKRG